MHSVLWKEEISKQLWFIMQETHIWKHPNKCKQIAAA